MLSRYKVVISDQVFPTVDLERSMLSEIDAELHVATGDVDEVLQVAHDADAVLNTYLPWDVDAISQLEKCRIIARYGIGFDNVDIDAAREAGIVVTNVPDYSVEEVGAHALALILAMVRKIPWADRAVREGRWAVDEFRPISRLSEYTAGLIGLGRIGSRLAQALAALDIDVVVHDPYLERGPDLPPLVELDELLARSDIISMHAPLTDQTKGMIDAKAVAAMKDTAILVNTSRGPLVELDAVISALKNGELAGAAFDVFDREPLDPTRIEDVPNLIATPHMAYYSEEALNESQFKATTQVIKVLTGEKPDYRVNP